MKKLIAKFLCAVMVTSAMSLGAAAYVPGDSDTETTQTGAPNMSAYSDDAQGLSSLYADYIAYYLPGVPEADRTALQAHVQAGYEDGSIAMMGLMSAYTSVRKAGQAGEAAENQVSGVAPTIDVINGYYKLTDAQKTAFAENIQTAFALGLDVSVADGKVAVTKDGAEFITLSLVVEKPKSSTRIYLDAYTPALSDDVKTTVEKLVGEYGAEGGSPAGSGAVWRCIREIGAMMGVEASSNVDMEKGTMSVTVTKTGVARFADVDADTQAAIIAKADEAFKGLGLATSYADGVYTVTKNGETRIAYTLLANTVETSTEAPAETTADSETAVTESAPAETVETSPATGNAIFATVALCAVSVVGINVVSKSRKK